MNPHSNSDWFAAPGGLQRKASALAIVSLAGAVTVFADRPSDIGPTSGATTASAAIVLKLHNQDALAAYVEDVTNPASNSYRQYLSVADFTSRYAPTQAEVNKVVNHLKASGLTVSDVSANRLVVHASGTVAAFNQYFATSIHDYTKGGRRYHAPATPPKAPTAVSDSIATVVGLSSQPIYWPKKAHAISAEVSGGSAAPATKSGGTATGVPGQFTVGDVVNLYNVQPLYDAGFKGKGQTVGIATLATFDPNDAVGYWAGIGLKVKPNRISLVHVDGGAGTDGADETTLDVEQSGGLAPQADIIVYDAPNTDQGFIDVFLQAVLDNTADTLSVSWGAPEIATTPDVAAAQDELFLEAAAQGMSLFAASGDAGAFDINDSQGPYFFPECTTTLTTDSPASSPYITAAGGLTLAGLQAHRFPTPVVNVPADRPWGWNYLAAYLNTNYGDQGGYYGLAFPVGGGGGVSVNEPLPRYQKKLSSGIHTSQPSQSLVCQTTNGPVDLIDMPDDQPGRNVPDLSLNADPYTGYLLYFQGQWIAGFGGTSFVAPQLNGITSVISQKLGTRLGLLNPAVYRLARLGGYGKNAPFNDITAADNLGFQGAPGYDPASGIGSINAASLARALAQDAGE